MLGLELRIWLAVAIGCRTASPDPTPGLADELPTVDDAHAWDHGDDTLQACTTLDGTSYVAWTQDGQTRLTVSREAGGPGTWLAEPVPIEGAGRALRCAESAAWMAGQTRREDGVYDRYDTRISGPVLDAEPGVPVFLEQDGMTASAIDVEASGRSVLVGWHEPWTGGLHVRRSDDAGVTWRVAADPLLRDFGRGPHLHQMEHGDALVLKRPFDWKTNRQPVYRLQVLWGDESGTFSGLPDVPVDDEGPAWVTDHDSCADGNTLVLLAANSSTEGWDPPFDLSATVSVDGGETWRTTLIVGPSQAPVTGPTCEVNDGVVHIAYYQGAGEDCALSYARLEHGELSSHPRLRGGVGLPSLAYRRVVPLVSDTGSVWLGWWDASAAGWVGITDEGETEVGEFSTEGQVAPRGLQLMLHDNVLVGAWMEGPPHDPQVFVQPVDLETPGARLPAEALGR